MFSSLTTKVALRRLGLPGDALDFAPPPPPPPPPPREPRKLGKARRDPAPAAAAAADAAGWPAWVGAGSLPLAVQPWLSPPPPPVRVAPGCPGVGDPAPLDRGRRLVLGGGRRVLVVFLRCVGCAFAQKTFVALRALANRYQGTLACVAVSHASAAATQKWVDLLGGAWNVQVVVDEDRAVYAAWGLGLGSVWHVLGPAAQAAAWREKGWLGATVAGAVRRAGGDGPAAATGSKWQQAGAFAVDGRGTVVWGGKANSAEDVMDLETGARLLGL